MQPPVDSIAEFKIQQGYFGPQFIAPAVINVATKSGTNSVHGAVWEFVRNDKLNARNFFETDRGPFKQNQFGFNVGGPAIKNKLFWFGDYEGLRLLTSSPGFAILPTTAELSGDFSGQPTIYDPEAYNPGTGTRQPFPGNVIPSSRISSFAKAYNQFIPAPNSAPLAAQGGANFVGTARNSQIDNKWDVRGDLDWSSSNRFFARVSNIVSKVNSSGLLPHSGLTSPLSGTNAVFAWTHIFNPNVVNEFRAGLNRAFLNSSTPADASGPDYAAELGFHNLGGIPVCNGVPPVGLATFASFGEGNENCEVNGNTDKIFRDSLNIVRGRHSISLGFDIWRINWRLVDGFQVAGAFTFTGQYSGNSAADYLLGAVQTAGGAAGALPTWRTAFWPHVFINDNFHVNTKLTLNMGLGWQYTPAPGEKYSNLWGFNFQTGQMIRCGTQGMPHGCMKHNWLDFSPRFGIAYAPVKNWAIRTSYGVFWDRIPGNEWVWNSTDYPFQTSYSEVSEPNIPTINLSQLFPAPPAGIPGANPPAVGTALFNLGPYNREDPSIQQWTFSIQHTLPGQILTELAYVGSKGTHLSKRVDANVDPSPPALGDTRTIQERRPYPQYGFFLSDQGRANSEYEALQASAKKAFGHGLTFLSGFTWGKSLDNDSYDGKASRNYRPGDMDKGRSIFDVRYRFTLGAVYNLPFGNNLTGVKKQIIGGWQLSPIISAQSGLPFQVSTITDPSNTGVTVGLKRPNRKCDGNLPDSQRTREHWFNTGCFTLPAQNTYGDGGVAYLDTDGFSSVDLALSKVFPLTEKVHLEFRAEAFNSLNTVNFNLPGSTLGTPTFGVISSAQAPREFQFALKILF